MKPDLPVWRSLMYLPVNVEKYVDKAHTRGADCIQLDLEDSVPAAEKDAARKLVGAAAARVRRGGADVVVRINRPDSMAGRDLDAAICADVDGIAVTKADNVEHLRRLDDLVSRLEAKRGLRAGGLMPLGFIASVAGYGDREAFRRMVRRSRRLLARLAAIEAREAIKRQVPV